MSQGPNSIWFHRAVSINEFSMIGAVEIEISQDRWSMSDKEMAKMEIEDYRETTLNSGHVFKDKAFKILTLQGKRFFADAAILPAIHSMPIDPNLEAHELVYIFIMPREPSTEPHLYFFIFTDVHHKDASFEDNLKEFHFVLKSFKTRITGGPT